jgi:hypothetical protein
LTLIKPILVIGILGLLLWGFRHRSSVGIKAGIKVVAVGLTAVAIATVVYPNITQQLADLVGVTRGTDLVLYTLVIVFGFAQAGTYFKFRALEVRMARLVRMKAIQDAVDQGGLPGAHQPSR